MAGVSHQLLQESVSDIPFLPILNWVGQPVVGYIIVMVNIMRQLD